MLDFLVEGNLFSFTAMLSGGPGNIVGPIAGFMGIIFNAVFNAIYSISPLGSLGIAIIVFTILTKIVLFPLSYNQYKSNYKLQSIQPGLNKIRDKYKGKTDQESMQRMNFELQEYQRENGVSLFGGCLPLLIQLPLLYGLFYVFRQPYNYIEVIGSLYDAITNNIMNIPVDLRVEAFREIALSHNLSMDLAIVEDVKQLVTVITQTEWTSIMGTIGSLSSNFTELLSQKHTIEYFFGMNLISNPGLSFPGIIIPILSGFSTWFSTKLMTRESTSGDENDPTAKTMKSMNIVMPLIMGWMTISVPAALGVYWTVSNFCQIGVQAIMLKFFAKKDEKRKKEEKDKLDAQKALEKENREKKKQQVSRGGKRK